MRCVFIGTPGFLGRVDGTTRCASWTQEPDLHGFDPAFGHLLVEASATSPDDP